MIPNIVQEHLENPLVDCQILVELDMEQSPAVKEWNHHQLLCISGPPGDLRAVLKGCDPLHVFLFGPGFNHIEPGLICG